MGLTHCMGKYGLMVFSILFVGGVVISCSAPQWISTVIDNPATGTTVETEFGPFNSRTRTCVTGATEESCDEWDQAPIAQDDCSMFDALDIAGTTNITEIEEARDSICKQNKTWRVLAEICFFIVVGTAILVALATCTQCITCGCCGGSFDQLAMVLCYIEVILSIVCWSFAISVVTTMKGETFDQILGDEVESLSHINIGAIRNVTDLDMLEDTLMSDFSQGNFMWGFWLFMLSGTVCGLICAIFAQWAAEGSLLQCVCQAITGLCKCICCLK